MFKKYTSRLIAIAALVLSCVLIYAGISNNSAPSFVRSFSQAQALEDFNYMWDTLEENFPLWNTAYRISHASPSAVRSVYQKKIEENPNITYDEFYQLTTECLSKFKGVGHLNIVPPSFYNSFAIQFKDTPYQNSPIYIDLFDKNVETAYKYLSSNKNANNNFSSNSSNLLFKEYGDDTAYVKIYSFMDANIEADAPQLLEWFKANCDKKNIIIDITSNGGGNDNYWIEHIVAPNISEKLISKSYAVTLGGSDFKKLSDYFNFNLDINKIMSLPNVNKEDLAKMKYAAENIYSVEPLSEGEKLLNGDIYVLIDNGVGSASEGFAAFCKNTGFATLVGSRTKGDGMGGISPIVRKLPNSHLLMFYRIAYGINPDGSNNAEFGTPPNIKNPPLFTKDKIPNRALNTCLNHLGVAVIKPNEMGLV